ncbi:NAD(P)H-binding protein [Amycolatopsis anabasis]|uniref:NAD(P)H-binding protein n=1 Tax=Amycolatopsis anabasis TaxID=1840409 RepID=UPI00131AB51F|nr:NAD(P)H-binding protein [Amycolatopsis anabasis]
MSAQGKILVTGATGKVGRQVVAQLLESGAAVRALVRNPETAGLPAGVEVVRGDLLDPSTVDAALPGVGAVFLVWPGLSAEVARPVVDTIARRARRIVYLSSMGVREELERQADPINQFHADLERVIERSGLEWTFLRAGGFAGNTLGWAPQVRAGDVVRDPFGAATRSLIHEADIAAVGVRALTGDGHAGAKYVLTGPEAVSTADQVRLIGEAIGRPLRFEALTAEAGRRQLLDQGWDPVLVDAIFAGRAAGAALEPVTSVVEEITGSPARTFRQWALDHAGDFR